jgi:hypothetical protein
VRSTWCLNTYYSNTEISKTHPSTLTLESNSNHHHQLDHAYDLISGPSWELKTPRWKHETGNYLCSESSQEDILLNIKMRHIQVLIPNENVLIGLHNILVQKPLRIPPAAKWAHQCSTLTTSTHHSQHLISKEPINVPLIQTNKPSRLLNVLDKELIGSTDVKI